MCIVMNMLIYNVFVSLRTMQKLSCVYSSLSPYNIVMCTSPFHKIDYCKVFAFLIKHNLLNFKVLINFKTLK